MICKKCGKTLPDDSLFCQYCGTHSEDLAEETVVEAEAETSMGTPETEPVVAAEPITEPEPPASAAEAKSAAEEKPVVAGYVRYCQKCGSVVDPETKKCTKCGKQYFKFPMKGVLRGLVAALIIAMGVGLVYLYNQNQSLQDELVSKTKTAEDYKRQLDTVRESYYEMILEYEGAKSLNDFYDNNVVIAIDGDRFYHYHDCTALPTFWMLESYHIYDSESAKESGFSSCPSCGWRERINN